MSGGCGRWRPTVDCVLVGGGLGGAVRLSIGGVDGGWWPSVERMTGLGLRRTRLSSAGRLHVGPGSLLVVGLVGVALFPRLWPGDVSGFDESLTKMGWPFRGLCDNLSH
ncbi:hypothetical protein QQ045_029477 [Rhodiola kirilowii]